MNNSNLRGAKMGMFDFLKKSKKINNNGDSDTKKINEIKVKNNNVVSYNNNEKFLFFNEFYVKWINDNSAFFEESERYYSINCCINCGVKFEKEITTSVVCHECKARMIVRTNPDNKEKILLLEKDKKMFDKIKEKYQELKIAEEMLVGDFEFFSQYENDFYSFKEKFPITKGYNPIDIIYHFQNYVRNNEETEAIVIFETLSQNQQFNFQNSEIVTKKLYLVDYLVTNNISLLFLQKKYNVLMSYLPIETYHSITKRMVIDNICDSEFNADNIVAYCYPFCNMILELLKEKNMKLVEFKKFYLEFVNINLAFYGNKINLEDAWYLIEKGVNNCLEYAKKMGHKKYISDIY